MSEQGIKQTEGKTSFSEIDWSFVEKMAKCMNLNKGKYPSKNWQKPMNASLLLDAAQRHLIELQKDNLFDKENGAEHAVAVALNMMMYSYQQNNRITELHDFGPKWGQELLDDLRESNDNFIPPKWIDEYEKRVYDELKMLHQKANSADDGHGIVFGEESQKTLDTCTIEKLQKELDAAYKAISGLEERESLKFEKIVKLQKEIDSIIVLNHDLTHKVNDLTFENNKLKKELEAIKNSPKNNIPFSEFPPYPQIKYYIKPPLVVNEPFSKPPFVDAKFDIRF
jgi:Domain of unknown function (DUF5664)